MYDRLAKLVPRIHEKSQRGEIPWQKSADGRFESSFPGYTVEVYSRISDEVSWWGIRIYNEEGDIVEDVDDTDLTQNVRGQPWEKIMKEIYEMARRKALRIDQAIDELISELER
jgi:hypothetical protein